ncbi:MAG TPA: DinB family protein [Vicinamibacterales bacterium]
MDSLLRDLYGHQEWADAESWRAIEAHPPARDDPTIRDRLHHIHIVQRAFRWVVGSRDPTFSMTTTADFATLGDLKAWARAYHDEMAGFLATLTPDRLDDQIGIPWFADPPLRISVAEALTQCAMHSQHHRGQNATRLRELGGEPPGTDLITWIWKGRPSATWGR